MRKLVAALVLGGLLSFFVTASASSPVPVSPGAAGLDLLKARAGDWYQVGPDGEATDALMSQVRVTAGGSAVHETHFPGQPHEMMTLYYIEEGELTLVHYCVLGNQPKMRAVKTTDDRVEFECTGLSDESQSHMHTASIHLVSESHNHLEWANWTDGEPGQVVVLDLVTK